MACMWIFIFLDMEQGGLKLDKYRLKFKNKGENRFLYLPIEDTEKKEAITEAIDFIWARKNIEEAYLEQIIHEKKDVWSYKES